MEGQEAVVAYQAVAVLVVEAVTVQEVQELEVRGAVEK
jgi:hypothetical protein